jgi:hypothetical protein
MLSPTGGKANSECLVVGHLLLDEYESLKQEKILTIDASLGPFNGFLVGCKHLLHVLKGVTRVRTKHWKNGYYSPWNS